ncbi:MAG: hypothetical protein EAZ55_14535 [Cytophagales bacterium]|nr:MAG: hypothetical protein EAZ55_14535 [Cytophagales bacterium]
MENMVFNGKVVYQQLGTGFWGIVAEDGQKYKPVQMPAELQKEGLSVSVEAREAQAQMSVFMWGKNIEILSFKILAK